jgi:hypothetical protein
VPERLAHDLFAVVQAVSIQRMPCSTAASMAFTDRASSLSPHQLPPPMAQVPIPRKGTSMPLFPIVIFCILFSSMPEVFPIGGLSHPISGILCCIFVFYPKRAAVWSPAPHSSSLGSF